MKNQRTGPRSGGFAFSELLAIIVIMLLLGLVVLPAPAKAGRLNHSTLCLFNKKALMVACGLYLDDNHQQFPGMLQGNMAQGGAGFSSGFAPWALGWLDWTTSPDNTNANFLTNSKYSSLARYLGFSQMVFKCPADGYLSDSQKGKGWTERVRSIGGDGVIGQGNLDAGPFDPTFYKHVTKLGDLQFPSPSQCWMYADEHPDSINDPLIIPPLADRFVDQLGNYHDGSCALVFVDGHTELYRWKTPQVRSLSVRFGPNFAPNGTNNFDINWVRSRTPHQAGP